MISKELLSKVCNTDLTHMGKITLEDNSICLWGIREPSDICMSWNIYELAHMCKNWALTKNKCLSSTPYHKELYVCTILGDEMFQADSEPEAIFKACKWILEDD